AHLDLHSFPTRRSSDLDAGHEALLLETVYEPLEFIPLEPGPFSDPGKGHRAVRGEEALHERFDGILHFLRGRVEGRIQVPRGPRSESTRLNSSHDQISY